MNEQMKKILSEERESISPKGDLKSKLDKAFEAKHEKKSILPLWATYPVPVWQMAASVALLIVAGIVMARVKPEDKPFSPVAIADTIYIEKIIPGKNDTVFIEKEPAAGNKKNRESKIEQASDELPEPGVPIIPTVRDPEFVPDMHISDFHNIQPNGSSLGEDSSAKSWTVRIM